MFQSLDHYTLIIFYICNSFYIFIPTTYTIPAYSDVQIHLSKWILQCMEAIVHFHWGVFLMCCSLVTWLMSYLICSSTKPLIKHFKHILSPSAVSHIQDEASSLSTMYNLLKVTVLRSPQKCGHMVENPKLIITNFISFPTLMHREFYSWLVVIVKRLNSSIYLIYTTWNISGNHLSSFTFSFPWSLLLLSGIVYLSKVITHKPSVWDCTFQEKNTKRLEYWITSTYSHKVLYDSFKNREGMS